MSRVRWATSKAGIALVGGAALVLSLVILVVVAVALLHGADDREVLCRALVQAEVDSAQALVIAAQRNALRDGASQARLERIGRDGARYVIDVREKVIDGLEPVDCEVGLIEPAPPIPPVMPSGGP